MALLLAKQNSPYDPDQNLSFTIRRPTPLSGHIYSVLTSLIFPLMPMSMNVLWRSIVFQAP